MSESRSTFAIAKTDEAERLVFGYANVAVDSDGSLVEDLQGDMIEASELEKAAYDFMLHHRVAGEMHNGSERGHIVESMLITPEKLEAMGFTTEVAKAMGVRWWIGAKLDAETFGKVKSGQYRMFSIEGSAKRVAA